MHRARWLHMGSQRGTDLYRQQPPMFIAMFDRLRQRHRRRNHPPRASTFACQLPLTIGLDEDAPVAVPAIAQPVQRALMSPLDGGGHCVLDQILAQRTGGAGNDEATVPVLDQAAPALSFVRLGSCALFFCTNDQNSSISTWLRCRSLASTCVRASA